MRRAAALSCIAALALLLGACGQPSSATKFKGDQQAVAQVVENLQTDGERNKPDDICANLLTKAMQDRIATPGSSCGAEMKKVIQDADAFNLDVQSVTIAGATATAQVKNTDHKALVQTFKLTKEASGWRIEDFGSSG
jgi:hypothetical protein